MLASAALRDTELFDLPHLRWMLEQLRAGSRKVDAGLFFKVAVLGLWLDSLETRKGRC